MTTAQEGSIVRCITRLDELLRDVRRHITPHHHTTPHHMLTKACLLCPIIACAQVRNAARVVGNPSLYRKMEAASQCIKRDIVFAASLYVA